MTTKICTKCKQEKPVGEYNKNKKRPGGLSFWCKACKREHYQKNIERRREYGREYYQKNIERRREYGREYYLTHN